MNNVDNVVINIEETDDESKKILDEQKDILNKCYLRNKKK